MKRKIAGIIRYLDKQKFVGKIFVHIRLLILNKLFPISSPHLEIVFSDEITDIFFGYYDKCPENKSNSMVLMNRGNGGSGQVLLYNRISKKNKVFTNAALCSQLGSRCFWHSDSLFSYNTILHGTLGHVLVDTKCNSELHRNYPIYTVFQRGDSVYELAIDFSLIYSYRAGYGYNGLVPDWLNGKVVMLTNDNQIAYSVKMNKGIHYNHFVYISHLDSLLALEVRSESKNQREETVSNTLVQFDWMSGEFQPLQAFEHLAISHFSHYDGSRIIGTYLLDNSWKWAIFDLETSTLINLETMGSFDGHPTVHVKDGQILLAYDSYPDLLFKRQKLIIGDKLYSIKYSSKYIGQDRNDLHPRFGHDGLSIWIDSVENGKRELWKISL